LVAVKIHVLAGSLTPLNRKYCESAALGAVRTHLATRTYESEAGAYVTWYLLDRLDRTDRIASLKRQRHITLPVYVKH